MMNNTESVKAIRKLIGIIGRGDTSMTEAEAVIRRNALRGAISMALGVAENIKRIADATERLEKRDRDPIIVIGHDLAGEISQKL